jgi:hypothetical protein
MKRVIIGLLAISILMSSCDDGWGIFDKGKSLKGKGAVERTTRETKDFKSINLATSADVFVKQGAAFKLEVEGQKNIMDVLETSVEGGILTIKLKENTWNMSYDKLNVYVEMPNVEALNVSGSGNMTVETALSSSDLTLSVSGSGNVSVEKGVTAKMVKIKTTGSGDVKVDGISVTDLTAEITGSGNIELSGTASKAEFTTFGSGDIKSKNLICKTLEASSSGSGNINCHADESLDVHTSGSGDIEYSGNATNVKSKATGSGDISKK